jgi:hypothetical protein
MARGQERQIIGGGISPQLAGGVSAERDRQENRLMEAMRQQGERTKLSASAGMQERQIQAGTAQQALQQKAAMEMQDKQLAAEEKGRRDDAEFRAKENQFSLQAAKELELMRNDLSKAAEERNWTKYNELMRKAEIQQKAAMWHNTFTSLGTASMLTRLVGSVSKGQADEQKAITSFLNMSGQADNDKAVADNAEIGTKQSAQVAFDAAGKDSSAIGIVDRILFDTLTKNQIDSTTMDIHSPDIALRLQQAITDGKLDPTKLSQVRRIVDGLVSVADSESQKLSGEEKEEDANAKAIAKFENEEVAKASLPARLAWKIGKFARGLPKELREKKMVPTLSGKKYDELMEAKSKLIGLKNALDSLQFSNNPDVKKASIAGYNKAYGTGTGSIVKDLFDLSGQKDSMAPLAEMLSSIQRDPMSMLHLPVGYETMMEPEVAAVLQGWLAPMQAAGKSMGE